MCLEGQEEISPDNHGTGFGAPRKWKEQGLEAEGAPSLRGQAEASFQERAKLLAADETSALHFSFEFLLCSSGRFCAHVFSPVLFPYTGRSFHCILFPHALILSPIFFPFFSPLFQFCFWAKVKESTSVFRYLSFRFFFSHFVFCQ